MIRMLTRVKTHFVRSDFEPGFEIFGLLDQSQCKVIFTKDIQVLWLVNVFKIKPLRNNNFEPCFELRAQRSLYNRRRLR